MDGLATMVYLYITKYNAALHHQQLKFHIPHPKRIRVVTILQQLMILDKILSVLVVKYPQHLEQKILVFKHSPIIDPKCTAQ